MNMQYVVHVRAGAQKKEIQQRNNVFHIWTLSAASEGKANTEVIAMIAEYFHVPKSRVFVIRGEKNKQKVVEIL
ncbi:MAG: DUF167 domain-containing protein [Candidatus Pacebacteria bacterium]|nr:DUF167 domain-containing protein [Candidatus Paceibacterota bacterium]